MGPAPEPNLTVLYSSALPESFKKYAAKVSIDTSSVQYENDDVMKPVWGDDYSICCCVSATQTGKEMQFFGARANLAKCLLYAINGGVDEKSHEQCGPNYAPITSEYLNYDEVLPKYVQMLDWLAGLYVNVLNLIQYMHDKYYYEEAEMAISRRTITAASASTSGWRLPPALRGVVALRTARRCPWCWARATSPSSSSMICCLIWAVNRGRSPSTRPIAGETLNILMGSRPLGDSEDSDRVKLRVLDLLHEKYGICEDDLTSAELEVVPAFNATDIGLDGSLIGAYGHDDRVCSYAALKALLELETPTKTAVCMLADKEEIGSEGVSGMLSQAFEWFMGDMCRTQGVALF